MFDQLRLGLPASQPMTTTADIIAELEALRDRLQAVIDSLKAAAPPADEPHWARFLKALTSPVPHQVAAEPSSSAAARWLILDGARGIYLGRSEKEGDLWSNDLGVISDANGPDAAPTWATLQEARDFWLNVLDGRVLQRMAKFEGRHRPPPDILAVIPDDGEYVTFRMLKDQGFPVPRSRCTQCR